MSDRVIALLDRPTARSLGMLGLVLADDRGALRTSGILGSQSGPIPPHEFDELVAAGDAKTAEWPPLDAAEKSFAALWVGAEFAEMADNAGVPLPPLSPQASGKTAGGTFWIGPVRHVWRVLDSWIVTAFRRVVEKREQQLATLMSWSLPDRIETRAARWLTAPNVSTRERELTWWVRLDKDRGNRQSSPASLETTFSQMVEVVESSPKSSVLGLCAPAKGGDNEIARFVEEQRHLLRVSFGAWLRAEAEHQGISSDRMMLQKLGREAIENRGALAFCLDVLEKVREPLPEQEFVIEGIRHLEVRDSVRALVGPDRFVLAFVDRPLNERRALLKTDEGLSEADVMRVLSDPTEAEIPQLRESADIELNAQLGAEVEGRRVMQMLST